MTNLTKRQREVLEALDKDGPVTNRTYIGNGRPRMNMWWVLEMRGLVHSFATQSRVNYALTPAGRKALEEAR